MRYSLEASVSERISSQGAFDVDSSNISTDLLVSGFWSVGTSSKVSSTILRTSSVGSIGVWKAVASHIGLKTVDSWSIVLPAEEFCWSTRRLIEKNRGPSPQR